MKNLILPLLFFAHTLDPVRSSGEELGFYENLAAIAFFDRTDLFRLIEEDEKKLVVQETAFISFVFFLSVSKSRIAPSDKVRFAIHSFYKGCVEEDPELRKLYFDPMQWMESETPKMQLFKDLRIEYSDYVDYVERFRDYVSWEDRRKNRAQGQ